MDDKNTQKPPRAPRRLKATVAGGFCGTTHGIFFDDKNVSREAVSEADEARLKDAFPGVIFSAFIEAKPEEAKGEQAK